jgi:hypothetical protein
LISTPMWLLMGGLLIWISTAAPTVFAIPLASIGAFGILSPAAKLSMWASCVTVKDDEIAAVAYAGIRTQIRWEEIRRVEQVHSFMFDCSEIVRVVGRRRSFVFTDAIEGYRELMDVLDVRAGHAPRVPLALIWRTLFDAGFRNEMPRHGDTDSR